VRIFHVVFSMEQLFNMNFLGKGDEIGRVGEVPSVGGTLQIGRGKGGREKERERDGGDGGRGERNKSRERERNIIVREKYRWFDFWGDWGNNMGKAGKA
jgi:hypothetical protein